MSRITPQEIGNIIKSIYPQAQVQIIYRGSDPNMPSVPRYNILTHLFGSLVQINCGENMIILLDGHVVDALKNIPLLGGNDIKKAVEFWLKDIQNYLSHHDLPLVKHLARKYLGNEVDAKREKRALYISYDKFYIVISPFAAFLFLKSTHRLVYFMRYDNESELERFFKLSSSYADSIIKGGIR